MLVNGQTVLMTLILQVLISDRATLRLLISTNIVPSLVLGSVISESLLAPSFSPREFYENMIALAALEESMGTFHNRCFVRGNISVNILQGADNPRDHVIALSKLPFSE
jgi:hypothetical protein